MASRGDVVVARRRLGFGTGGRKELFVVLQADDVSVALGTTIVAPLDDFLDVYERDPLAVRVPGKETGARGTQFVLPQYVTSAPLDRFEPVATGRLRTPSLRHVDAVLSALLGLRGAAL